MVKKREETSHHSYTLPHYEVQNETVLSSKLEVSMEKAMHLVVPLPSLSPSTIEKFSVISNSGSHEFVHVFKSTSNNVFIKCCSGICQSIFKKKKNLHFLTHDSCCEHLKIFKSYFDENLEKHPLFTAANVPSSEVEYSNEDLDIDEAPYEDHEESEDSQFVSKNCKCTVQIDSNNRLRYIFVNFFK